MINYVNNNVLFHIKCIITFTFPLYTVYSILYYVYLSLQHTLLYEYTLWRTHCIKRVVGFE